MGELNSQIKAKPHYVISAILMAFLTFLCMWPSSAFAQQVQFPDKPAKHSFVVDQAEMLSAVDLAEVNQIAQTILVDERIPIYVVTINSLDDFGANSMSIEGYSQRLFDHWGIGYKHRNYGMLLIISKSDRRMRIELGKEWAGKRNQDAQYLVNQVMSPRFKDGYFSEGILEGVRGMDKMGRGLTLPSPYYKWWVFPTLVTIAFFAICISISMFKSGKNGVGWGFLIIAFAVLAFLLDMIVTMLFNGGDGDGFGGGFSGGGGASGGW